MHELAPAEMRVRVAKREALLSVLTPKEFDRWSSVEAALRVGFPITPASLAEHARLDALASSASIERTIP